MASVAMILGGAVVNALAFSGSNYLFSKLGKNSDDERLRHDKAIEDLEQAQANWNRERTQRLDFINEQLQKQQHAVQTFDNVDQAMKQYFYITGKKLNTLGPEPKLSDFYKTSEDQQNREILFIILGLGLSGILAYKLI